MEQRKNSKLHNCITISEFGLTFLKQLPAELQDLQNSQHDKQNTPSIHNALQRRGAGLDFSSFANQTQTILKRQTFSLSHLKNEGPHTSECKRKLQLHYSNWLSDQKLLHHKIADQHSRMEQMKYCEYDWRTVSSNLKERSRHIIGDWSEVNSGRLLRKRDKLGKLLARKYPKRQES